jgi:hypothetical protein
MAGRARSQSATSKARGLAADLAINVPDAVDGIVGADLP